MFNSKNVFTTGPFRPAIHPVSRERDTGARRFKDPSSETALARASERAHPPFLGIISKRYRAAACDLWNSNLSLSLLLFPSLFQREIYAPSILRLQPRVSRRAGFYVIISISRWLRFIAIFSITWILLARHRSATLERR